MRDYKPSNLFFTLVVLLYPLIVYLGFKRLSLPLTNFIILGVLMLRVYITWDNKSPLNQVLIKVCLFMLVITLVGTAMKQFNLVKLYPVLVNLTLAGFFLYSLRRIPVIEQFASLKEEITPAIRAYTWKLTVVWAVFFVLNASISLYTFMFSSLEVWTLYNALISYILIGILFGIELIVRYFYKKRVSHD